MKIVNGRTGKPQDIPFALGETGRGRTYEEVRLDNRNPPTGPEDVGYVRFGSHVALTRPQPGQTGILLRVDTRGTYTKNNSGRIELLGGDAECICRGTKADGAAGYGATQTDELWHCRGSAVFNVVLSGGVGKGYGRRILVVTADLRVVMFEPDRLAQVIAADDEPAVSEVCRAFRDKLDDGIRAALDVAQQLEDAEPPATAAAGRNYISSHIRDLAHFVQQLGLQIAPGLDLKVHGTSGVKAGTIMPGNDALIAVEIGPGGGKRHAFRMTGETGIEVLAEQCERPYNRRYLLARVIDPLWRVTWEVLKDNEVTATCEASASSIRYNNEEDQWL